MMTCFGKKKRNFYCAVYVSGLYFYFKLVQISQALRQMMLMEMEKGETWCSPIVTHIRLKLITLLLMVCSYGLLFYFVVYFC